MRFALAGSPASYRASLNLVAVFRAILLSVDFLFFLYAFHAAISIRYWFAIAIAIDIRYRSSIRPRLFSIASSDIDIERTTITRCGLAALGPLW
uniref:Uncharacterized protein n=1 Tax=Candidatus Kentrum sp. FM TaxID=2126340 RepID=A0A450WW30_9GAMM|nr:MAG: hypothetical protein BECKFM1743B_GA0114221_107653 [Candidatus Kentron sp. FM]